MEVAWLESLLALLEHGNFSRAAEAQHISQPTLSRRIRALEHWAGADLVDRSTYPVSLTPAGVKLRESAAAVVASLGEVRDELRGRQLMPQKAVRVAISHTVATHYFPGWWACLGAEDLRCLVLPSNTLEGYDALVHGGCDLLMAYADPSQPLAIGDSELEWVVLARDRLAPYSRCDHEQPLFRLPGVPQVPVPFVSHGSTAFLGRVTDRLLRKARPCLRPVVQSDFTSVLVGLVEEGVGVGWLPRLSAGPAVTAGRLIEVGSSFHVAELEIRLLRSRTRRTSPQARTLWERARDVTEDG